jgi:hypothetical protein
MTNHECDVGIVLADLKAIVFNNVINAHDARNNKTATHSSILYSEEELLSEESII